MGEDKSSVLYYNGMHKSIAEQIRRYHHNPVSSAPDLRSCVIRLQEIIDRQIMHGKERAHTQNRYKQHNIIHGIRRTSGQIQ